MDPQLRIKTHPRQADVLAREWGIFLKKHPDAPHFEIKEQFVSWAKEHDVNLKLWEGKEITDAYFSLREQQEETQMQTKGFIDTTDIPIELTFLPFLAAAFIREKPKKIMQNDEEYKKIVEKKKAQWQEENPGKDQTSIEWINYQYGSLENPNALSVHNIAEKEFRENPQYANRVKKHDDEKKKIYNNPAHDPIIAWQEEEIEKHARARHEYLKKQDPLITIGQTRERVAKRAWDQFVEDHPTKAKTYALEHEGIKTAIARITEQKKQIATPKIEQRVIPQPPPSIQQPRTPPASTGRPPLPFPGIPGAGLTQKLAQAAAGRAVFIAFIGGFIGLFLATLVIVMGTATTLEASPEENKSGISPTISPPSQSPLSETAKKILDWTIKISNVLEEGPLGDYNKMIANITNGSYNSTKRTGEFINTGPRGLYWCTNLVIDVYNLAGKSGLNDNHQAVVSMRNFWKTAPGYIHLDYLSGNHQNILSTIFPGFAIFFESQPGVFTGNEHVAIIKSKSLDSRGNGFIETYDANTNAKTQRYPVVNWDVKNQLYTLVAFGIVQ
ncbi:MAG: hypothetical protein HYV39_02125 [Candidatus Levybacteria bacterium]|nr:hypothetical protein [Candidatus Levybacteria bacterium]